jgi:hypothetical protein
VFVFQRADFGRAGRERLRKVFPLVMVSQTQIDRSLLGDRSQESFEILVSFDLASESRQVARNDDAIRRSVSDLSGDLLQVAIGIEPSISIIGIRGYVGIGEERPSRALVSVLAENPRGPERCDARDQSETALEEPSSTQTTTGSIQHTSSPPANGLP